MARYVNVDELCEYANNQKDKSVTANDFMRFPTVDAEPVKHGHWKLMTIFGSRRGKWYCASCSECGQLTPDCRSVRELPIWNYCPRCGCKMDEVAE